MNSTLSHDQAPLDPERPWIEKSEDLPARLNWFETLLNPLGQSSKLHFTRAWTALFFTQFILWFGVSTLILGIASLIGADVSFARGVMTYVLAGVFILTTLLSVIIHIRRLNHAGKSTAWALLIVLPLLISLAAFSGSLISNKAKYDLLYEAHGKYLEDPEAWREAQIEKRREAQARMRQAEAEEKGKRILEDETLDQCLARRKDQDNAVDKAGREAAAGDRRRGRRGNRSGGRPGGRPGRPDSDPLSRADQPPASLEEVVLRPAVATIPGLLILLTLPVAVWSLLWVARTPLPGLTYSGQGLISLLFGFKGRIGRQQFWLGQLCNMILTGLVFVPSLAPGTEAVRLPLLALAGGLFIWIQSALSVKRLHDFGVTGRRIMTPWLITALLIGLVGLIGFFQQQDVMGQMAGCAAASPMVFNIAAGFSVLIILALHMGFYAWLGFAGPNLQDETYGLPPQSEVVGL